MIEQFNSEKYMDDEYTHYTNTIAYIAENIDYLKD
jgi:hypothetical protein